jgi:HK97 gp10 family phage protein
MAAGVEIIGLKEVEEKFRRMSEEARGERLAVCARAGALLIQNGAKKRCPVDTGTLRRSIHTEDGKISSTRAEVVIGTDVDYAPYVEYGTGRMRAQPYMRPALDEEAEAAGEAAREAFLRLMGV